MDVRKELKLQDELIQNKKKLKNRNFRNRLHLIEMQEKVEDILKPVIDPLKKIDESMKTNKKTSNQLAIPQLAIPQQTGHQIQKLNTDPIKGVTEKLARGIRPVIYKNRNPPEFHIGKKQIPINYITDTFDIILVDQVNKIPITQKIINLINGDDEKFDKYEDEDYVDYYTLLEYVKKDEVRIPNRMKKLKEKIDQLYNEETEEEESIEEGILDNLFEEISGEGLKSKGTNVLFNKLKLLLSARNEGHNNLDDNIQKILNELVKR